MIDHTDLLRLASNTLSSAGAVDEAAIRRSVSTLYYSLFHQLSAAAVAPLSHGGPKLSSRAARALEHRTMLKVCEKVARWNKEARHQGSLESLLPAVLDHRLVSVADAFVRLQEARLRADYELGSEFERQDALTLLEVAGRAASDLDQISSQTTTVIFLAALLLNDRWSRSG